LGRGVASHPNDVLKSGFALRAMKTSGRISTAAWLWFCDESALPESAFACCPSTLYKIPFTSPSHLVAMAADLSLMHLFNKLERESEHERK
jgi:hypothetical protein